MKLIADHDAIVNEEKSEEIWQDEIVEPLKICNNALNDHNHIDAKSVFSNHFLLLSSNRDP